MFIPGQRHQCTTCGSTGEPRLMNERWDGIDKVVVGCAVCLQCGARALYSRFPTPNEAQAEQRHGYEVRMIARRKR